MSPESRPSRPGGLLTRLRTWRASIARLVGQPRSVTLLSLDPEEVARRVEAMTGIHRAQP